MNDSYSNNESSSAPRRAVAEIISIGDEILTGAILDTNAQYLSRSLSEFGVRVLYLSTIGDELDAMIAAFRTAFRRADVVLVTGGLGPTQDDLTRQAVADALGVELKFDPESFEHIRDLFARRGRPTPESNKIQAYFPDGATILFNPNGTAPGFLFEGSREIFAEKEKKEKNVANAENVANAVSEGKKRSKSAWVSEAADSGRFVVLSFPGVPAEMKEMWDGSGGKKAVSEFADRLAGGKRPIYRIKTISSFGAGESAIEEKLPNLIARDRAPRVGITAKESVIALRIFAEGASEAECERQIDATSRTIYSTIGEFVFGEDGETLASVVGRSLRAQCRRVGVFEWGTRGLLAAKFDSDVFGFGRVFGESERDAFERLFGAPGVATNDFASPSSDFATDAASNGEKSPGAADVFSASSAFVGEGISNELRETLDFERSRAGRVDYCLAVGPFPSDFANDGGADERRRETASVAFVDLRDPKKPVLRRETFCFGGHPAVIDALFCNRAFDMLRKYQ